MFRFWNGENRWKGYKGTAIMFGCGIVKAFIDNYWVMTDTPLDEHNTQVEDAQKFFYMNGAIITTVALYSAVGLTIDYLRSFYHQQELANENEPIFPRV